MRRPFIAGNWKMNTTAASARELAAAVAGGLPAGRAAVDVLVAPPFPYLAAVRNALQGGSVLLAGQNASAEPPGAFTGEVAVEMLADVGCSHVILGHSERRHGMGETDEIVCRKVKAALAGGLDVILCVGELLEEREAGRTESVLDTQIEGSLAGVTADDMNRVTIAYEPVWAIGTGVTASPEQAEQAHSHLRKRLADRYNSSVAAAARIQYGGSVKPDNAAELLGRPDIDGALVGGASLNAASFLAIIAAGIGTAK
ncbi:MAG: triose-phosphate isomerase [Planctomycetaceae bacterium]